jgi:hypothetical protein
MDLPYFCINIDKTIITCNDIHTVIYEYFRYLSSILTAV